MMYREPKRFEFDFIERTLDIVDSYSGEYDITLFINAMVGLFVIPKEKHIDELNDSMIDSTLLMEIQKRSKDTSIMAGEQNDLKNLTRRIRNAVSHGNIVFEAEEDPYGIVGNEIARICFYDDKNTKGKKQNYQRYEFYAKIEIDLLKVFVTSFAKAVLINCGGSIHA